MQRDLFAHDFTLRRMIYRISQQIIGPTWYMIFTTGMSLDSVRGFAYDSRNTIKYLKLTCPLWDEEY